MDEFQGRLPDAAGHQRLCSVVLEHPLASELSKHEEPFSAGYRDLVLELYALLSGNKDGYQAERDERSASDGAVPSDLWKGLVPWSFQDPRLASEFLFSWGQILRLLDVGAGGRVLEYGPGSGQLLLMLARLGVSAYGVDVDGASVEAIRRQAEVLGLHVEAEVGVFGSGFDGVSFDRVIFFEAFHHAFDFTGLLSALQGRVAAGGRIVLCGEPIVDHCCPEIPFAWGPRLDGLSVFSMRRWGWMELGFTRELFVDAAGRSGWATSAQPFPGCPRANAFVLRRPHEMGGDGAIPSLTSELEAIKGSTSWRVTAPLRALQRRFKGWVA